MMLAFQTEKAPDRPARADAFVEKLRRVVSPATAVRRNEPMAKRTTLRVGGLADVFLETACVEDLSAVLNACREDGMPLFVIGRGSNLLVRDGGFPGVVVSLAHPGFSTIQVTGRNLRVGAGARLKQVAVEARNYELGGFEFLEGIPGTVGGALRMNAGAMGSNIFDLVESVDLMDCAGKVITKAGAELGAVYRSCEFFEHHIALAAVLIGRPGTRSEIEQRMQEFSRKRWSSQPAAPSAGCMFKNPQCAAAGKLIDDLGLKGTRVGGARVSQEHGNFLVTDNTATARDVAELIALIREKVRIACGVALESEVQVIGQEAENASINSQPLPEKVG